MPKAIIAGPCVSEFGWELMEWQGYVRALASKSDVVVVCTSAGLEPLYQDMNPIFIPHSIKCARDSHVALAGSITNPKEVLRARDEIGKYYAQFLKNGMRIITVDNMHVNPGRRPIDKQRFVKYGMASNAPIRYPIVVHARTRHESRRNGGDNYSIDAWNTLLAMLVTEGVISRLSDVAAIGTSTAALAPYGVSDLRDAPLQVVMDTLAAAELAIGPSSGPLHLASLCGTPHVVWAIDIFQLSIGCTNRDRYVTYWNPFKTPAHVELHKKGYQPDPDALAPVICSFHRGIRSILAGTS